MQQHLALLFSFFILSAQAATVLAAKPYDVPDAYEIYSIVLAQDHHEGELLIADTTVPFQGCLQPRTDDSVDSAIEDYMKTNQKKWHLERQLDTRLRYKLLSRKKIASLRKSGPTGKITWQLPAGTLLYRFSAVGFNADKTVAFLQTEVICGPNCIGRRVVVLQKANTQWIPIPDPSLCLIVPGVKRYRSTCSLSGLLSL